MADTETKEEPPKQGGQIMGCIFAALAAGLIFLGIIIFLRACS